MRVALFEIIGSVIAELSLVEINSREKGAASFDAPAILQTAVWRPPARFRTIHVPFDGHGLSLSLSFYLARAIAFMGFRVSRNFKLRGRTNLRAPRKGEESRLQSYICTKLHGAAAD